MFQLLAWSMGKNDDLVERRLLVRREDVPMAHRGGALAVAVHTGIRPAQSFADLPEGARPHLDLPDVGDLAAPLTHNWSGCSA